MHIHNLQIPHLTNLFELVGFDEEGIDVHVFRGIGDAPLDPFDDEEIAEEIAIECVEEKDTVLVEVTLLTGTQQHIRESFSIHRHLEEYVKRGTKSYSVFISPKSFIDTERYFDFIKKDGLEVRISDIDKFVNSLEMKTTLNEATL